MRSTSPSSLLLASLDAARRHAVTAGAEALEEAIRAVATTRKAIASIPGFEVLDERLLRHPGVYDYDPLRLAIDVRGTGATGYELADMVRVDADVHLELAAPRMLVAIFGSASRRASRARVSSMPSPMPPTGSMWGRRAAGARLRRPNGGRSLSPRRQAFFGRQEQVPLKAAVGRVARRLSDPSPDPEVGITRRRLVLLAAASLLPTAIRTIQSLNGDESDVWVTRGATVVCSSCSSSRGCPVSYGF